MAVTPNVNDAVTVSEGVYPLLGIGVSEFINLNVVRMPQVNDAVTLTESMTVNVIRCPQVNDAVTVTELAAVSMKLQPSIAEPVAVVESVSLGGPAVLSISVADSVGLVRMVQPSETITVTESVSLAIGGVVASGINVFDAVIVHDDGQGVALQGGPGAIIQVTVIDNVALSKLIIQSDALTVTESTAMTIAQPGAGLTMNLFENIAVTAVAYVIPDDYVFVTESVSVYFRQVNASAFDAVTVTELAAALVQGGTGASVKLNVNDTVVVADAVGIQVPFLIAGFDAVIVGNPAFLMVPLMPKPIDAVSVAEAASAFIGKLQVLAGEDVAVVESVSLRFSRLFINIAEDVSIVESNGISRPSQSWEAGAVSVSTWDSVSSNSSTWQPGAVETGVWG